LHDSRFHLGIVRSTQNHLFLQVVNTYYVMSVDLREVYFSDPKRRQRSLAEHRRLLNAIEQRSVDDAVSILRNHLKGVDSYWRGLLTQAPAAPKRSPFPEKV
jgi:DNA-binding FadR family transcriptional regulator